MDAVHFHSLEVRGAVLPHTVQELCDLMKDSNDEFSLTIAAIDSTKAFSEALRRSGKEHIERIFFLQYFCTILKEEF